MAIDPSFLATGSEWQIGAAGSAPQPEGPGGAPPAAGQGFGQALAGQIDKLDQLQAQASQAAQALATGQASDPSQVVMAVERAQLAMQLASQLRTKAVEAAQDIFHTQV